MKEVKYSRTLRPDHQMVDEVVIKTIPRYKDSELSGDEWRISAIMQYRIKGKVIREDGYRDVQTAMDFIKANYHMLCDEGRDTAAIAHEESFCDQEGCARPWTHIYKMKSRYSKDGTKKEAGNSYNHRAFCDRHKQRGDCGLDDANANYELVYSGMRIVDHKTPDTSEGG